MNALLPIIRRGTPAVATGAPAIIAVTSSFDLPQNEQQNPRAFIFAIIVNLTQLVELQSVAPANILRYS